jgi:hypothetical protein
VSSVLTGERKCENIKIGHATLEQESLHSWLKLYYAVQALALGRLWLYTDAASEDKQSELKH